MRRVLQNFNTNLKNSRGMVLASARTSQNHGVTSNFKASFINDFLEETK